MRHMLLLLIPMATACSSDKNVGVYNTAPSASITTPPAGSSHDEGTAILFEALVDDDFDSPEELTVKWSSDIDGEVAGDYTPEEGISRMTTANLSPGNQTVTIKIIDTQGKGSSATVSIIINDLPDAPALTVAHPSGGEYGVEGEDFEFVAKVTDNFDAPEDLLITFESDVDGVFCEPVADVIGVATCDATLTVGDHLLTFSATNSEGFTGQGTAYFPVLSRDEIDDDEDGWTESQGDCDDGDDTVYPGAEEFYNGRDDDCDGVADNDTEGYDDDGDGQSEISGDCDDTDANTYTGATETCDGEDDDCDGTIDETTSCYDDDSDGYTEIEGDCDDSTSVTHPGATEIADSADNDCDGIVDEGTVNYDDDGDGYTETAGDCDDTSAAIHPGATEKCGDGVDNDCDGSADEENASGCTTYYYDYDGDAYGSATVSGKCLCTTSGYYTSVYDTDCYDYNSSASPSQTTYQTSHRGDGSYDWNCDSVASKYYGSTGSCSWNVVNCTTSTGWKSSVAACGATGTWLSSCSWNWLTCSESTKTQSQKCL